MTDTSSVFHLQMLDAEHRANFDAGKPWLFETHDTLMQFETEEAVCDAQREYRTARGFDPLTGKCLQNNEPETPEQKAAREVFENSNHWGG